LYERCLANGLKACVVFSHAAGLQVATITCSLPTTSTIAATANKRLTIIVAVGSVVEPPPL
jgi:hypothetical protein